MNNITIEEKVPVFLTPEESILFVEFQKRYTFMKLMESLGAFSLKNASLEIHYDSLGAIAKIDIHNHYRLP